MQKILGGPPDIVIEGAGSPAEINLRDQVNNRICAHVDASALYFFDEAGQAIR